MSGLHFSLGITFVSSKNMGTKSGPSNIQITDPVA